MGGILEDLELEQPTLVTIEQLAHLVTRHGLRTPTRVVAARLRERGWLLPTGQRGVWEFAPAATAGPYSRNDPLMPLRAFLAQQPTARCALTFQAAAWAHGLADRVPAHIEIAAGTSELARRLRPHALVSVFPPHLPYHEMRGVQVLAVESVLVHMTAEPRAVRSWASAVEWLPGLAAELCWQPLSLELADRPAATRARAGYLLQGVRPDLATAIQGLGPLHGKTWFGPRGHLLRHDNTWQIADTSLPFDPRTLRAAA